MQFVKADLLKELEKALEIEKAKVAKDIADWEVRYAKWKEEAPAAFTKLVEDDDKDNNERYGDLAFYERLSRTGAANRPMKPHQEYETQCSVLEREIQRLRLMGTTKRGFVNIGPKDNILRYIHCGR